MSLAKGFSNLRPPAGANVSRPAKESQNAIQDRGLASSLWGTCRPRRTKHALSAGVEHGKHHQQQIRQMDSANALLGSEAASAFARQPGRHEWKRKNSWLADSGSPGSRSRKVPAPQRTPERAAALDQEIRQKNSDLIPARPSAQRTSHLRARAPECATHRCPSFPAGTEESPEPPMISLRPLDSPGFRHPSLPGGSPGCAGKGCRHSPRPLRG